MSKASFCRCVNVCVVAVLLFLQLSCTRWRPLGDAQESLPITLRESTGGEKTIVQGVQLPDSYTIYASAYYSNLTEMGSEGDYFVARPFRKNNSIWTADPPVYWPLGGKLDFLFTACEDEAIDFGSCAVWSEGNGTKGVEADIPDGACLDSEILFGSTLGRKQENGSIPIRFKHAQSCLQFLIKSDASDILRIDRIVIANVYAGGTLRVSSVIYPDALWSFRGHQRTNLTVPGSEGIVVASGASTAGSILLPEQETCDISLYYSFRASTQADWSAAASFVSHYRAGSEVWHYGEKTVYTINFSFRKITFTTTVETWGNDEKEINVTDS